MIKKKLLALAGVLGILACGACFLPPLPRQHAALPPNLASVHLIAIHVEDATAGNLFDPLVMSNATASKFNQLWNDFPVRAEAFNAGEPGDAALRITVLRKTASCNPEDNGNQFCSFELTATFILTAADGRILQSSQQKSSKFGIRYKGNSLPEHLNVSPFMQQASYSLAMTAGDVFLFPAHSS
jgi:hypothetical protein